ncbi:DUF6777 domain-containing protein [Streptomyces sp. NPDC004647]|uniref:DUF6777 domain-containing protein n=1 Tax=Streptomyces sp. NPDC004647 TaxID=3154671 RepID=UPI0033A62057
MPGEGPSGPWWRSAPRVAIVAGIMVAALAVIVFLTRSADESNTTEIFLEAASSEGSDPFTESTAEDSSAPASPTATPRAPSENANGTPSVEGSAPGLYGGTRDVASCDVEQQIDFLKSDPVKGKAFAGVVGIDQNKIPSYLRSLTPVQLRMDTRVTNHGFRNGEATSYQAVMQAGTAVLVGPHGVPRVRCACGNPLQPPVELKGTPKQRGDAWPGYQESEVIVVAAAPRVVNVFVLFDPDTGTWFERRPGDTGSTDRPTSRPSEGRESPSPPEDSTPTSPSPDTSPPSEPPESPGDRTPESPPSEPVSPPESPAPEPPAPS